MADQQPPSADDAAAEPLPPDPPPFQFSLRKLMLWVAAVALVCGIAVSVWRAISAVGETIVAVECRHRLEMIAEGFQRHHAAHRCLPPVTISDANGKPMHSWRVSLLRYTEGESTYERYDFSRAWNSPKNMRIETSLTGGAAGPFQCPDAESEGTLFTRYVAVTGPHTLWDPAVGAELSEKYADKILVVEIADSDVHWMEPRDLTVEEAMRFARGVPGRTMSSNHPAGINCIMGDGHCRTIPGDIDPETLREMFRVSPER